MNDDAQTRKLPRETLQGLTGPEDYRMVKKKRRISEPVYEVKDNNAIKIFDHFPGRDVRNEFLEHLRLTGKPQDWRFHLSTTPPRGTTPRIITEFVIPERLRGAVLMAPCPICSPRHPKYWEGMLAWFEDERALRAIGRECGHHFLGNFSEAVARYRRDVAADSDLDFIIRNSPKVSGAIQLLTTLYPRARVLDLTRRAMRTVVSKAAVRAIHRHMGGTGQLTWVDVIKATVTDAQGNIRFNRHGEVMKRDELVVARRFDFPGIDALRELDDSTESRLITAEKLLDELSAQTEDQILEIASAHQENLTEVVFRIRRAWEMIDVALAHLRNSRYLLRVSTVETLGQWGADRRAVRRIRAAYVKPGLLEIGEVERGIRTLPIHGSLLEDLPVLTPLD